MFIPFLKVHTGFLKYLNIDLITELLMEKYVAVWYHKFISVQMVFCNKQVVLRVWRFITDGLTQGSA